MAQPVRHRRMIETLHQNWFYVAVSANGVVGLWGIGLAIARRDVDRRFRMARSAAIVAMLLQVGLGLLLYADGRRPPDFHIFYGFLILFTYTFAYIYRASLDRRPALSYGLMLLFVMGLGIRAWLSI